MTNYTCYSCANIFSQQELSSACLCYEFKGICKDCKNIPYDKWNIQPTKGHAMIPVFSNEIERQKHLSKNIQMIYKGMSKIKYSN